LLQFDTISCKVEATEFEALIAVVVKSPIFCDITPCSPLKVNRRSKEHVASIFRVEETGMNEVARSAFYLLHDGFLLGLFFDPEDGGDMFL
jgi:hypothetical protein